MERIRTLILALALGFSVVGCGAGSGAPVGPPAKPQGKVATSPRTGTIAGQSNWILERYSLKSAYTFAHGDLEYQMACSPRDASRHMCSDFLVYDLGRPLISTTFEPATNGFAYLCAVSGDPAPRDRTRADACWYVLSVHPRQGSAQP